jgi:hypothetical protein
MLYGIIDGKLLISEGDMVVNNCRDRVTVPCPHGHTKGHLCGSGHPVILIRVEP